jgi:hypothetical protein
LLKGESRGRTLVRVEECKGLVRDLFTHGSL